MSWRSVLKTKPETLFPQFNSGDIVNIGDGISGLVSAQDEARILTWLAYIEEVDPVTIRDVLDKCQAEPDALAYYLKRAREVPDQDHSTPYSARCGVCRHFKRVDHPNLGHCAQGEPESAAGLWDTDTRHCERYHPALEIKP